jgi:hypothetical protein
MAKKNKHRSVSTNTSPSTVTTTSSVKAGTRSFSQDFNPDYTFVKRDLKNIAILASVFVVILVVLSFVLR